MACMKPRAELLVALLACAGATAQERRNWFNDPFERKSDPRVEYVGDELLIGASTKAPYQTAASP